MIDNGATSLAKQAAEWETRIQVGSAVLDGEIVLPEQARGMVLFAHGSGSSRKSPRNQYVARALNESSFGTLLFDLLTPEEAANRANVFDIALLAERLAGATIAMRNRNMTKGLPVAYFGASTGAAAALQASTQANGAIRAIVSRGGRPDLAAQALPRVTAPTLLIVGEEDRDVLKLNENACNLLRCEKEIRTVPGATHLFEEPGAMDRVIEHATAWLERYV